MLKLKISVEMCLSGHCCSASCGRRDLVITTILLSHVVVSLNCYLGVGWCCWFYCVANCEG